MRIAMLCSSHRVNDARVTYKQAASLAKAGHEVTVFGVGGDVSAPIPGVRLVSLADRTVVSLWNRAKVLPSLYRAVVEWNPDVFTCHEPESALAGLFIRTATGAKLHFDVHELFHETLSWRMRKLARPIVKALSLLLLRCVARRCDWITVVSPANRDFYMRLQRHGRVDIIHNSPMPDAFPLCNQDATGPVTICHEGHLGVERGMVQILKALAIAREKTDVRLLLLGRIRPTEQSLFDQTVNRLGIADVIEGPKWIDYTALGQAVSRAQIGIVCMQPTPNNYLSLSNKLYNYMACGQAVIVPVGSASADLAEKFGAGLSVDTTSPEKIAEAMITLGRDASLRKRFGTNGRRAIEDELGWHKMAERLLEIHQTLLREKR